MSHKFKEFRGSDGTPLHHTVSPPHDHDLNPIAERIIGVISTVVEGNPTRVFATRTTKQTLNNIATS